MQSSCFNRLDALQASLWCILIAIMPLEHVPALRLMLLAILFVMVLVRARRDMFASYMRSWPMLAWVLFCSATWFWSMRPQSTAYHLRADLLPSILAFGVFAAMAKNPFAEPSLRLGMLMCALINAALAIVGHRLQQPIFAHYYSDVGYSSTIAVINISFALSALWFRRSDKLALAVLLCSLLAGIASANRLFVVILVIAVMIFMGLAIRQSFANSYKRHLIWWMFSGFCLIVVGGSLSLDQAFMGKIARLWEVGDPRPKIWGAWLKYGLQAPFFGNGYGRNVGEYSFGRQFDMHLLGIDPLAVMHSHNLFLNAFVETGLVGLALFCLMWASFAISFLKGWHKCRPWGVAGLAIMVGFLLKNQTDIFFLKSTMILIMGLMGYYIAACDLSCSQNETKGGAKETLHN